MSWSLLFWFCVTSLSDWLKKLAPLNYPIIANLDSRGRVFPRFMPSTCISLVRVLIGWLNVVD